MQPGTILDRPIKRTLSINGTKMPGLQIDVPETVIVETSQGKRIPSQFANVISLRTPRDGGEPYLRLSRENLGFSGLRFSVVEGLDVVSLETGEVMTLQMLEERRLDNIAERQALRAAQSTPESVDLELAELGLDDEPDLTDIGDDGALAPA